MVALNVRRRNRAKGSSICLGAVDTDVEEQLVGYLIISRYADAWHIMNVAVDPECRRRGVATKLLNHLFELTGTDDRRGYTLEVRVSNGDAIKLYEGLGFVARGIRRGYYHGQPRGRPGSWGKGPRSGTRFA